MSTSKTILEDVSKDVVKKGVRSSLSENKPEMLALDWKEPVLPLMDADPSDPTRFVPPTPLSKEKLEEIFGENKVSKSKLPKFGKNSKIQELKAARKAAKDAGIKIQGLESLSLPGSPLGNSPVSSPISEFREMRDQIKSAGVLLELVSGKPGKSRSGRQRAIRLGDADRGSSEHTIVQSLDGRAVEVLFEKQERINILDYVFNRFAGNKTNTLMRGLSDKTTESKIGNLAKGLGKNSINHYNTGGSTGPGAGYHQKGSSDPAAGLNFHQKGSSPGGYEVAMFAVNNSPKKQGMYGLEDELTRKDVNRIMIKAAMEKLESSESQLTTNPRDIIYDIKGIISNDNIKDTHRKDTDRKDTDGENNQSRILEEKKPEDFYPRGFTLGRSITQEMTSHYRAKDSNFPTSYADYIVKRFFATRKPRREDAILLYRKYSDVLRLNVPHTIFHIPNRIPDGQRPTLYQTYNAETKIEDLKRILYSQDRHQKSLPLVYGPSNCVMSNSPPIIFGSQTSSTQSTLGFSKLNDPNPHALQQNPNATTERMHGKSSIARMGVTATSSGIATTGNMSNMTQQSTVQSTKSTGNIFLDKKSEINSPTTIGRNLSGHELQVGNSHSGCSQTPYNYPPGLSSAGRGFEQGLLNAGWTKGTFGDTFGTTTGNSSSVVTLPNVDSYSGSITNVMNLSSDIIVRTGKQVVGRPEEVVGMGQTVKGVNQGNLQVFSQAYTPECSNSNTISSKRNRRRPSVIGPEYAKNLFSIAVHHDNLKQYNKSLDYYHEFLKICFKQRDFIGVSLAYHCLGVNYQLIAFQKADDFHEQNKKKRNGMILEEQEDNINEDVDDDNVNGCVVSDVSIKDLVLAIDYHVKSRNHGDIVSRFVAHVNLGTCFAHLGDRLACTRNNQAAFQLASYLQSDEGIALARRNIAFLADASTFGKHNKSSLGRSLAVGRPQSADTKRTQNADIPLVGEEHEEYDSPEAVIARYELLSSVMRDASPGAKRIGIKKKEGGCPPNNPNSSAKKAKLAGNPMDSGGAGIGGSTSLDPLSGRSFQKNRSDKDLSYALKKLGDMHKGVENWSKAALHYEASLLLTQRSQELNVQTDDTVTNEMSAQVGIAKAHQHLPTSEDLQKRSRKPRMLEEGFVAELLRKATVATESYVREEQFKRDWKNKKKLEAEGAPKAQDLDPQLTDMIAEMNMTNLPPIPTRFYMTALPGTKQSKNFTKGGSNLNGKPNVDDVLN